MFRPVAQMVGNLRLQFSFKFIFGYCPSLRWDRQIRKWPVILIKLSEFNICPQFQIFVPLTPFPEAPFPGVLLDTWKRLSHPPLGESITHLSLFHKMIDFLLASNRDKTEVIRIQTLIMHSLYIEENCTREKAEVGHLKLHSVGKDLIA